MSWFVKSPTPIIKIRSHFPTWSLRTLDCHNQLAREIAKFKSKALDSIESSFKVSYCLISGIPEILDPQYP